MSFCIVIPSRNVSNLIACVESLRARGETARVLAVDDGLDFNDWAVPGLIADELGRLRIQLIEGAKPFCFGRNVNLGVYRAIAEGYDFVVAMNDDAVLLESPYHGKHALTSQGGLSALVWAASMNPAVGVLSSAVVGQVGPLNPREYPNNERLNPAVGGVDLATVRRLAFAPFVCVCISREVFAQVGLLDERFWGMAPDVCRDCGSARMHPHATPGERLKAVCADCGGQHVVEIVYGGEDNDYCYRARLAGFDVGVYDGCLVDHATLPSTFRPDGKGRSIEGARLRFQEIHGISMEAAGKV